MNDTVKSQRGVLFVVIWKDASYTPIVDHQRYVNKRAMEKSTAVIRRKML